jgi:thiosulfate/3-mercaptopyruvate sulfurtransferase
MPGKKNLRMAEISALAVFLTLLMAGILFFPLRSAWREASNSPEPWTNEQMVQPGDLAKELSDSKNTEKPIVVCVGFRTLYQSAHIRGAVFHGAASSTQGLQDLRKWAEGVPRTETVVLYCGCCPFSRCPNVRPAFEALRLMGFSHLKILSIPTDFGTDWINKGYPTVTGN